jgi:hypothetical protein
VINPSPELQQVIDAVEGAKMIDAAIHELRAAELRLSALILERKAGEKSV